MLKVYRVVLGFALLLAVSGDSWARSRPHHPPKQHPQTTQQPAPADQRGTEQSPAFVKIIPAPKTEAEAAQEAKDRDEKSANDRGIVRWTGAVAIFTLVLVGVGTWQGIQLKRTVDLALDTAQRDLRAYVLLEDTFYIYKGEHRFDAPDREFYDIHKLRIKNFGKTPAFNMSVWLHRSPTEIADDEIDGLLVKTHSEQALAPGHRYGPNFPIEDGFRHTDSSFVYGKFVYRDIYERWWVTRFCWQHRPNIRWTPYGFHNREDGPFSIKPS